ncbi:LOG family protein [Silvanigrella aquatica]|uniref:AMP nucleosidase n=1 Tax=Silvanigrella aquatica TaxID=1915309 RepID=A0A1L4D2F8_9BACT|nr:LOG family protein [Silvanigrella aquatica]APJ04393.1 hypothetical protein AXG55_10940 [Silvanigrella aquatica]
MKIYNSPSIGVICSTQNEIPLPFLNLAFELGQFLSQKGFKIKIADHNSGMVQQLCEGVFSKNGNMNFMSTPYEKNRTTELIQKSDLFIILPGGYEVLEKLITLINYNKETNPPKPIVVLDYMNYFSPFLNWLEDIANINAIQKPSESFCIARMISDLEKILT